MIAVPEIDLVVEIGDAERGGDLDDADLAFGQRLETDLNQAMRRRAETRFQQLPKFQFKPSGRISMRQSVAI